MACHLTNLALLITAQNPVPVCPRRCGWKLAFREIQAMLEMCVMEFTGAVALPQAVSTPTTAMFDGRIGTLWQMPRGTNILA